MSDSIIRNADNKSMKNVTGWDNAIEDAQNMIERLQRAIQTYRDMKAAGEPWPGSVPAKEGDSIRV